MVEFQVVICRLPGWLALNQLRLPCKAPNIVSLQRDRLSGRDLANYKRKRTQVPIYRAAVNLWGKECPGKKL